MFDSRMHTSNNTYRQTALEVTTSKSDRNAHPNNPHSRGMYNTTHYIPTGSVSEAQGGLV